MKVTMYKAAHYSIKLSKKNGLWLTYLLRARGQQGSLAYLVFT